MVESGRSTCGKDSGTDSGGNHWFGSSTGISKLGYGFIRICFGGDFVSAYQRGRTAGSERKRAVTHKQKRLPPVKERSDLHKLQKAPLCWSRVADPKVVAQNINKKPPLCKGRWHSFAVSEGLFYYHFE